MYVFKGQTEILIKMSAHNSFTTDTKQLQWQGKGKESVKYSNMVLNGI